MNTFFQDIQLYDFHLKQLATSKEISDGKSKALGSLKLLRSLDITAVALLLQDLLTVLHKVSLNLQKDGSVVADGSLYIKTIQTRIRSLEGRDGPFIQKLASSETSSAPSAG